MNATIQDLKTQIGQLANTMSHLQSGRSNNLPSQTISNPRGNPALQQLPRSTDVNFEPDADSQVPQQDNIVPLSFPTRTLSTRKPESDEELLRMFRKVEINIPLLDAIKQIPKYAKFLKELCVHNSKKMKGGVEVGGIVSTLTKNEEFTTGVQQALPKKCQDPEIFSIPCIGNCTLADAMLDIGASINVMPTSIYKSLNFEDLEPTGMTIQLANISVVQPLGVLEDVLVQVNEQIFPTNFYVLDIEDETADYDELWEVHNLSDSKDDNIDLANLSQEAELLKLVDQVCKHEDLVFKQCRVQVSETKKLFSAQVAMMFTTEYESPKRGRDREKIKVNTVKKTSVEVGLIVHTRAETNLANKDQKQARAKSVSDDRVQNHVPSGSNSSARKNTESDPNPTRADSISVNKSRPQH
ncbi:hypothetical protein CR513_24792, partial [Mucuna pruriens]